MNQQPQNTSLSREQINKIQFIEREYLPEEKEELQTIHFQFLQVSNLGFNYPGFNPVFKNFSFQLSRAETITLHGKSGSGKSTVIAILQKLYTAQSGSITVNNQSLNHVCTSSWRNIIGIVPQEIALLSASLLDNIGYGSTHSSTHSIIDFCNDTGFNQFFETLPQGYFTRIGKGGTRLSTGQKQLIALARALYRKPQLLILDEATSAMDLHAEKFSIELLTRFKWNMATILTTHKKETIKLADRSYEIL